MKGRKGRRGVARALFHLSELQTATCLQCITPGPHSSSAGCEGAQRSVGSTQDARHKVRAREEAGVREPPALSLMTHSTINTRQLSRLWGWRRSSLTHAQCTAEPSSHTQEEADTERERGMLGFCCSCGMMVTLLSVQDHDQRVTRLRLCTTSSSPFKPSNQKPPYSVFISTNHNERNSGKGSPRTLEETPKSRRAPEGIRL
ncbi:unnamed protein product [Pleuronectes platessa]|uniref:Uncharacterized protein n=1 Tax=Pleuronectes platessa TaxID=8262 RepID=A0A9N7YY10_PLEPL|nr:unnamed protein product [Pleuronectes platessa]